MTAIPTALPAFLAEQNGTLPCTSASASVGPFTIGDVWYVTNIGGTEAFIAFGNANVTTTAGQTSTAQVPDGGMSVPPGVVLTLRADSASTYVAGITASGTTVLRISRGSGV